MTDVMPDAAEAETSEPVCTAERHGTGRRAYGWGCRCAAAEAAHRRHLDKCRERNAHLPAQLDDEGNCIAKNHGPSDRAWRIGCRCPGSVTAHQEYLERHRPAPKTQPWDRWRGPDMRVNLMNLFMLLHGVPDSPTTAEFIAAVRILSRTPNRYGTGINDNTEIAHIIGETPDRVRRLKESAKRLAQRRDKRRLADVKLRAHRRAAAVARGRGHDRSGHPRQGRAR